jgi:Fe-S cluster assembly protein SufD
MTGLHTSYANDFRAQADALPGAHVPWLRELRDNAMGVFVEKGFPATRMEDWKYTDVRAVAKRHFIPPARQKKIDDSLLRRWWLDDEPVHRLVFIDGRYAPELNPFNTLLKGVTVTSLARALEHHPELLESRLGSRVDLEQSGFNAFNTAFMNDGAYIHLRRDVAARQGAGAAGGRGSDPARLD